MSHFETRMEKNGEWDVKKSEQAKDSYLDFRRESTGHGENLDDEEISCLKKTLHFYLSIPEKVTIFFKNPLSHFRIYAWKWLF